MGRHFLGVAYGARITLRDVALFAVGAALLLSRAVADMDAALVAYSSKNCKYNLVPTTLISRAYTAFTGEVNVHDVFGLPSTIKRHTVRMPLSNSDYLLTLQVEVHRDTPALLSANLYKVGRVDGSEDRILSGVQMQGAGGENTKVFMHGIIPEKQEVDIVFELKALDIAKSQVDNSNSESKCWPVRLDITAIPSQRFNLHWPLKCPKTDNLPPRIQGEDIVVLGENGLLLAPPADPNQHYQYLFSGGGSEPSFHEAVWSAVIEVPPRLHRFVRFFFRVSFRFASAPMQLMLELFDLDERPDGTDVGPKCALGCLGGVPIYNGQLFDHAMPAGFRYRMWLLRAHLEEWTTTMGSRKRCLEFDFDYSVKFEKGLTPYEVGPQAWLCNAARLPAKIVQTQDNSAWKEHVEGELIVSRSVWIRDRFTFPAEDMSEMDHKIDLTVSERVLFRASTHHSDGVDVFLALTAKESSKRVCKATKHPGPLPRTSIFCELQPGNYQLTFFADYPLGGLHPCGDFFAQIGIRPLALSNEVTTAQCVASRSDLSTFKADVHMTSGGFTPSWKAIKMPIMFSDTASIVVIWRNTVEITDEQAAEKMYLRAVLHSDYIASDLRFQVKYRSKYIADTQITAHGYADMIGPLEAGAYEVQMYYVSGTGAIAKDVVTCSTSMVDLRILSEKSFGNTTSGWLCGSTRVPLPEKLEPQPGEQTIIDSEYIIPETSRHTMELKFAERRLVRVVALSRLAAFKIDLRSLDRKLLVTGRDNIQIAVEPGSYKLEFQATFDGMGTSEACPVFTLNMVLHAEAAMHRCPWAPGAVASEQSEGDRAQQGSADHIGNLVLDLTPQTVQADVKRSPTKTLWFNQEMNKKFDIVLEATTAIRVEVQLQPAVLPLEIILRRVRPNGKIEGNHAIGVWTESRMLLLDSEVPKGRYSLELMQAERYTTMGGRPESDINNYCAHVSIVAEVGISSKEDINNLRSELLDLPELQAVQQLPTSINQVGWLGSSQSAIVGTQVYRFPDGLGKSSLQLDQNTIVRIVSEPADLSNAGIDVQLKQAGISVAQSDELGQIVYDAKAGNYELEMRPKNHASPFLVTLGFGGQKILLADTSALDTSDCLDAVPLLQPERGWSADGWTIGPTFIRLAPSFIKKQDLIAKIPLTVGAPSVLYVEVGSGLPLDLIRIAIEVPEGLWIGEQRGYRNSLEIEVPMGSYTAQLSQPKLVPASFVMPSRCLDISVYISVRPLNPGADADRKADAAAIAVGGNNKVGGESQELDASEREQVETASCFSAGTVPLPLDLSNAAGGSALLGGPMDKDGRLLLRGRVMITDMHDGRKKTYISTGGKKLQLKIGIGLGGYTTFSKVNLLSLSVVGTDNLLVDALEAWDTDEGWERVYVLDGAGFWLQFHHPHRERSASACIHFALQIEVHPYEDVPRMLQCPPEAVDPTALVPLKLDLVASQAAKTFFRISKTHFFLRQSQNGFLTSTHLTLTQTSWLQAEVGYNFFISHAEMDIVKVLPDGKFSKHLTTSHFDFIHGQGHELDGRLLLGILLEPGDYLVRVADDHYANQVSVTACFPFSIEFTIIPEGAPASVLSVMPHPSVPIARGADFVLALRFSEPPRASLEEVINSISFGGVKASLQQSGSMNMLGGQFFRSARVHASVGENHRLWVVTFPAEPLREMRTARLEIVGLTSNVTGKPFLPFSPPEYLIGVTAKAPWSGSVAAATSSLGSLPGMGGSGGIGAPVPESSRLIGAPRPEGGGSSSIGSIRSAGSTALGVQSFESDLRAVVPNVEEWSPLAPVTLPPSSGIVSGCPQGTVLNSATGVCEVGSASSSIAGYDFVRYACFAGVMYLLYVYVAPKMHLLSGAGKGSNGRYGDIGQRTSEEELGLVQNIGYEDDDML